MSTCTHDNKETQIREQWHNGVMYRFATTEFLMFARSEDLYGFPDHPWKDGQIVGDPRAMEPIS